MSFCSLVAQDGGIFVLTMATTDGHQYLNDEAITELVDKLSTVQKHPELRGLVITSKIGSFCDGIDYDNNSEEQAAHLAQGMAGVIRLLLEMPVPTAAAVVGNATSLGLALALAHDHCVVWDDAVLMLPEAQRGRPLPEYASALLRDKVAYARLRKLIMLKSQQCTGKELASTWYSAHSANGDRATLLNSAWEVLEGFKVGEGTDFAKARQIMWPESCAAVGVVTLPPRPRPSPEELRSEKAKQNPGEIFGKHNKPALQRKNNELEIMSSSEVKDLTFQLIDEITKQFSEEQKLGSGAYGEVYKGVLNGDEIAVKKLFTVNGLDDKEFTNEFRNLMKVQHQNIVRLIGYCYEVRYKHTEYKGDLVFAKIIERVLCFEYMQKGSLAKHISDESCVHDWPTTYNIIKGTCEGLHYLHTGRIYHLDLKPENILLDKDLVPKIADFGLSRLFGSSRTHVTSTQRGTIGFMPPEFIHQCIVTPKNDVFSLGVIIFQITAGKQGYNNYCESSSPQEFIERVQVYWKKRLQETAGYTTSDEIDLLGLGVKKCIEIAVTCVEKNREKRPSTMQIIDELNKLEAHIMKMSKNVPLGRLLS